MRRELTISITSVLLAACAQRDAPVGAGYRVALDRPPAPIGALDILFVVDDSGSMFDQQQALVTAAGDDLFAQLADDEGHLPDLHVGVISTSVGAGDWNITGCGSVGDHGLLQNTPRVDGCAAPTDHFLIDADDGAGGRTRNYAGTLADAFGCIAPLGTGGCGFEQPLESLRQSLDGSNPENAGFLRDDAMLLVVVLSDEDDCSTFDPAMFDTTQRSLSDPLGPLHSYRCFEFGAVCDPDDPRALGDKAGCVSREDSPYMTSLASYVEFLRGLKADPSLVMVAGIFGAAGPVTVTPDPTIGPSAIRLGSLCPTGADAYPAVRLNQFAASFPARYVFTSICDADMATRLATIAHTTAGVIGAKSCLLGDLAPSPTCRGFAVRGDQRRAVDVTIAADSAQCGYTPTQLAAGVADHALAADEHLVVDCLP